MPTSDVALDHYLVIKRRNSFNFLKEIAIGLGLSSIRNQCYQAEQSK